MNLKAALKKYRWPIISLLLVGITAGVLYFYGKAIVKELVQRYVQSETAGKYEFTYASLEYNLLDESFSLSQVSFKPISDSLTRPVSYKITLEGMQVNLADIVSLYTDKALHIQGIEIESPVVELARVKMDQNDITTDLGDLYLVISDYIKVLEIDYINLKSGTFIYANTDQTFRNIDFSLSSFRLDSTGAKKKVFYSEEINLKLAKQSFVLPDSSHVFSFDSFQLSTADSLLEFKNVSIKPTQTNDSLPLQATASIETLVLEGIDYVKAYQDRALQLDTMRLIKPVVQIHRNQPEKGAESQQFLSNLFTNQNINFVIVSDGKIDYTTQDYLLKASVDLTLKELKYDSLQTMDWFAGLEADLTSIQFQDKDTTLKVDLQSLLLSSKDNSFKLSGLNYINLNQTVPLDSISLAGLTISNVEPKLIIEEQKIVASALRIDQPQIYINSLKTDGSSQDTDFDLPFFNRITSDTIEFTDGLIVSASGYISDLTYRAQNFQIDSLANWNNLAADHELLFDLNYKILPYTLQASISYSESPALFRVTDFNLKHLNKRNNISGQGLIYGVELSEMISDKPVPDSIFLIDPVIRWSIDSAQGGHLPDQNLGKIALQNADVELLINGKRLSVDSLDFSGFYLGKNDKNIKQFNLKNFNLGDELRIKMADFRQSQGDIKLSGVAYVKSDQSLRSLEVQIVAWDQQLWWKNGHFNADTLLLSEIKVDIKSPSDSKKTKAQKNNFSFDKILMRQGRFHYLKDSLSIDFDYNIELDDFDSQSDLISAQTILMSNKALISISDISLTGHDLKLSGDQLHYNSDGSKFEGGNFELTSSKGTQRLSAFKIEGLKLSKLIHENELEAADVMIEKGRFELEFNANEEDTLTIPWRKAQLGKLEVLDSDYIINTEGLKHSLNLSDASLILEGVQLDSIVDTNSFLQHLSHSSFHGRDFSYPVDKGNYMVTVAMYRYNYNQKQFILSDIDLEPQMTRLEYSDLLTFQKDWFDVKVDSILIKGMNLHNILRLGKADLKTVEVEGLNAEVFRDKHVPFDSTQRRALPQELFKSLSYAVAVDTIFVKGDIEYSERPTNTTEIASIEFNHLNGRVINFATSPSAHNLPMYLRASGSLMNEADFTANVTFNMDSPENSFRFMGKIGAMDLTKMNRLLEPIANIRIKSGSTEQAQFVFDGDNELASGKMRLRYSDLKIVFLDTDDNQRRSFTQNLKTFFANSFVIHKSNPRLFNFRKGVIFFRRDKKRAIFNFWGKSILSGAVSSVGINRSRRNLSQFLKEDKEKDKE